MRWLFALALLAGACKSSKSRLDDTPAAGSARGSGDSTAGSNGAAPCDDAVLHARAHEALLASKRYFDALQQHSQAWGSDCQAVTKDMLTLEPDGDAFVAAMNATATWARSLTAECRARIQSFGEADPLQLEIEKRTPALEARVAATYQACHEYPGFTEAGKKALRLLKKKQ